jgi:hypothetical protein
MQRSRFLSNDVERYLGGTGVDHPKRSGRGHSDVNDTRANKWTTVIDPYGYTLSIPITPCTLRCVLPIEIARYSGRFDFGSVATPPPHSAQDSAKTVAASKAGLAQICFTTTPSLTDSRKMLLAALGRPL